MLAIWWLYSAYMNTEIAANLITFLVIMPGMYYIETENRFVIFRFRFPHALQTSDMTHKHPSDNHIPQ